jgi:hypothetical protein
VCEHTFVSRSSRIGETENELRRALDCGDPEGALGAARRLARWQAPDDLALGTALRMTLLLSRARHPLREPARRRCIERAQAGLAPWQLAVIAEAGLEGLPEPRIEKTCAEILTVLARGYEWTPVPAN